MPRMIVAIVQASTLAPDEEVKKAVAAIQRQVNEHLAPAWGARADLIFVAKGGTPPSGAWVVQLIDVCENNTMDGFHDFNDQPSGVVGVKSSIDDHCSWSSTLSHEVLELIVDPWATICIQSGDKVVALEICDPVEGQPYKIDDVEVEDFVLPSYYRSGSTGPWNYNSIINPLGGPLLLAKGGYTNTAPISDWKQDNAKMVRSAKRVVTPFSRRGRREVHR
jgi:hypothetical protein